MTTPRKPWQDYPEYLRQTILYAWRDPPYTMFFDSRAWAYSAAVKLNWMQADIRRQPDAPEELRQAAGTVKWVVRAGAAGKWQVIGSHRRQPLPGQIEAAIAAQQDGGGHA
jgi:hypothetical protein